MTEARCIKCGQTADEHHEFDAGRPPQGCKCDPKDWADPRHIPLACHDFYGLEPSSEYCDTCEHLKECHQ